MSIIKAATNTVFLDEYVYVDYESKCRCKCENCSDHYLSIDIDDSDAPSDNNNDTWSDDSDRWSKNITITPSHDIGDAP